MPPTWTLIGREIAVPQAAMHEIMEFSDRIARQFRPDKIVLFGSYAYGTPNDDSDVDLLVVMPFDGQSRDKSLEIWKALRPSFSVDLILRTPEETARRYREWDPLVREALDRGKVLCERDAPGVDR